ncbi:hypothetical protein ACTHQ6_00640 [Arthrobacter sp. SAFR-179]|uniref:hypothetical protein n=1 Tax=Arthrobacter sp. SAFR-179 TaxID=3387279 RepID=UPI003F7CC5F5
MSEVLNADVDGKEEGGFSRRRVVAGVAWSLPVIATAIAAPAAAASGVAAAAAIDGALSTYTIPELSAPGQGHNAKGPTGFHITNSGSQITGSITGLIRIEPIPAATGDPGVGVQSLTNTTLTSPSLSASNVFTGTFTIPGMASNTTFRVGTNFYYKGKKTQLRNFLMSVTLTYPDGRFETISADINLI